MEYSVEQKLICMTKTDTHYQKLLRDQQSAEAGYLQILMSLSPENREKLEACISLCEELEYRRTCLAYCLGTRDGVLQGCITCPDGW